MKDDNQPTEEQLALFRFLWVCFLVIVVLVVMLIKGPDLPYHDPNPNIYRWYPTDSKIDTTELQITDTVKP